MSDSQIKNPLLKYTRFFIALFFSLTAIYLRINRLAGRELWNDEIFQLSESSGPFKAFWQRHTYGDMTCFPGDYLLTYPFVRMFGSDKWGLAIPHLLMTMVGFYFLYLLCQRYFKTAVGDMVAFSIVCFNQHLVFHSLEFRPYAVLPTLALMAVYLTDVLVSEFSKLSRLCKSLIGSFLVLVIWFHAFGILIVFFPLAYFLLAKRHTPSWAGDIKPLAKFLAVVAAITVPVWLWYATGNPNKFERGTFMVMGIQTFDFIPNPLDNFGRFFNYTVFYHLIGFKKLYFLLGGLVLMLFIPYAQKLKKLGFFLVVIVLPIEVILLVDLANQYWFLIRQYVYLAPLLAFFLGWLWDSSAGYYADKNKPTMTFSSVIGLILLIVCTVAGLVGIVL